MPRVALETIVSEGDAASVFARISDFSRYAEHTDAVREVRVEWSDPHASISAWSVNFRNGVLCWRERDIIDPTRCRIEFEQVDGDFDRFTGTWQITQAGSDVTVIFTADFDLGMPSLAAIIDPIAQRTLRDNIQSILRGLLGADVMFPVNEVDSVDAASAKDPGHW